MTSIRSPVSDLTILLCVFRTDEQKKERRDEALWQLKEYIPSKYTVLSTLKRAVSIMCEHDKKKKHDVNIRLYSPLCRPGTSQLRRVTSVVEHSSANPKVPGSIPGPVSYQGHGL